MWCHKNGVIECGVTKCGVLSDFSKFHMKQDVWEISGVTQCWKAFLFMEAHMPKFCHGLHEFFFKVQHREEEYCDVYFVRLGSQKIWHVKLLNKVANVLAI